ncbi:hypothetical protein T07_2464 [Trichinella nelsoni]|uniref:Uncharacterized protein n=1 Tax=Trichinella nelsoni TaxID=6336 RepID=A0A0V0RJZ4_9BILA|nr:hypothetical protein T07_2464 [Trichinella nelsoni]
MNSSVGCFKTNGHFEKANTEQRYLTTAMQYLFGIMFDIAPILTNQNKIKARVDGRAVPVWKCVKFEKHAQGNLLGINCHEEMNPN